LISGWRRSVPVPLHGASTRTSSKGRVIGAGFDMSQARATTLPGRRRRRFCVKREQAPRVPVCGDHEPAFARARGEGERLSSGGRARIEDERPHRVSEEGDRELGRLVLNPEGPLPEGLRALGNAGYDAKRARDETARLDQDPIGRERLRQRG